MSFILRIMPPNEPPVEYALDLDRIRLGRSESNDIVVSTAQVSSLHLELRLEEDGYRLIDKDSTNGTRVNGKEVDEVLLKDGDELLIGNKVGALYSAAKAAGPGDAGEDTAPVAMAVPDQGSTPAPAPVKVPTPTPAADPKPRPAVATQVTPSVPVASPKAPAVPSAKPAVPAAKPRVASPAPAPVPVSAAAASPATAAKTPGGSAPTVVIKRSPGSSVPPGRPPIKIAKPMPPGARKEEDS